MNKESVKKIVMAILKDKSDYEYMWNDVMENVICEDDFNEVANEIAESLTINSNENKRIAK